jgi:hypothetical protein
MGEMRGKGGTTAALASIVQIRSDGRHDKVQSRLNSSIPRFVWGNKRLGLLSRQMRRTATMGNVESTSE